MSFRESEPNHKRTIRPDTIHRIATSMIASSGPIEVNLEDFSKPQLLILNAMKVLHLGGIALLIPNEKASLKGSNDVKP